MRLAKASVLLFHLLESLEFCFPAALQFAGDEPVFRFDDTVLPFCSLRIIASAFHTLLPIAVQAFSFLLQFVGRTEAQFQRSRFQRREDLGGCQIIKRLASETLTLWAFTVDLAIH